MDLETVQVGTVLYHHSSNYYHWMLEQLLKIRYVEHYESRTGEEVTLLVSANAPSFVYEGLKRLGYDGSRYTIWYGEPIRIQKCVIPSFPEPTPKSLEWLRQRMKAPADSPADEKRRVYISRQNAEKGRRVENYDEICKVMERYGIESVACESMTLEEEIELFSSAELIVGVHGAGLTAMIWAEDATVLEIFNGVVKGPFYVLSDLLGHNYSALAGTPVGNSRYPKNRDIVLDPEELDRHLDRITT